jgi:hypothetical protein
MPPLTTADLLDLIFEVRDEALLFPPSGVDAPRPRALRLAIEDLLALEEVDNQTRAKARRLICQQWADAAAGRGPIPVDGCPDYEPYESDRTRLIKWLSGAIEGNKFRSRGYDEYAAEAVSRLHVSAEVAATFTTMARKWLAYPWMKEEQSMRGITVGRLLATAAQRIR